MTVFNNRISGFVNPEVNFHHQKDIIKTHETYDNDDWQFINRIHTHEEDTTVFTSNQPHLQLLANTPSLRALIGINDQNFDVTNPANAYKLLQSFKPENVLNFLANSDADTVKTAIAQLRDLIFSYYNRTASYSVITEGRTSARTFSTPLANPFLATVATHESGDPLLEILNAFNTSFRAYLSDSNLTQEGGLLDHLVDQNPAILEELDTLVTQTNARKEVRDSEVQLARQRKSDFDQINQRVVGGGQGQQPGR